MATAKEMGGFKKGQEVITVFASKTRKVNSNVGVREIRYATSLQDPDATIHATVFRFMGRELSDGSKIAKLEVVASTDPSRKPGDGDELFYDLFRNYYNPKRLDEPATAALEARNLAIQPCIDSDNKIIGVEIVDTRASFS